MRGGEGKGKEKRKGGMEGKPKKRGMERWRVDTKKEDGDEGMTKKRGSESWRRERQRKLGRRGGGGIQRKKMGREKDNEKRE